MENGTLEIAASNLTVAYCFAINRQAGPGTNITTTTEPELNQEKILHIYHEFLKRLEEMKMVDR
ncbi:MAG TPA: hypothetical protein VIS48_03970 [Candidatus Kryptonia bacterium]